MKKLFLIGLKDVKLAFRDTTALLLMLLAPFLLTLGMGFVTGSFSNSDASGVSGVPVVLVNQDGGQLGNALVELFTSADLQDLMDATLMDDANAARRAVDDDTAAAVIVIPPGFTDSIIPAAGQNTSGSPVQIQIYTNPTRPTSAGVIKTILEDFINQVEIAHVGGEVVVTQLLTGGLIGAQDAAAVGQRVGQTLGETDSSSITVNAVTGEGGDMVFNVLAYMAPGMALMFLMYTAAYGGKALLTERNQGTLPRLLVSPTSTAQVLGGKVFGTFLTGTAQMLILIVSTALLFNLKWGDPLGVFVLVLAAVFAATGWGMVITAAAKTPGQAQWMGMVVMLIFGLLGGSFFITEGFPLWFRLLARITPNAWGVEGFSTLAMGGSLANIGSSILGLLVLGIVLFAVALLLFRRGNLA